MLCSTAAQQLQHAWHKHGHQPDLACTIALYLQQISLGLPSAAAAAVHGSARKCYGIAAGRPASGCCSARKVQGECFSSGEAATPWLVCRAPLRVSTLVRQS